MPFFGFYKHSNSHGAECCLKLEYATNFIYFGQGGDITSNTREDQEVSMLCLHLLQVSLLHEYLAGRRHLR